MTAILKGKLVVISTKTKNEKGLRVIFPTKKGGTSIPTQIPLGQLHPELVAKPVTELNNTDVDLELDGGQPRRVRPVGAEWTDGAKSKNPTAQAVNTKSPEKGDFHNPYNFIPAPPREVNHPELGDRSPTSHGIYHAEHWSGKITVTLTTITPLLIPDAARADFPDEEAEKNGHKSYPIRVDTNNQPYLPPTSIKGMLRSAYEAVTNSRFSVFEKHSDRLAYRMPANIGLEMVPARVEEGKLYLYPGTSQIGSDGRPQGAMYAAWLPRYNKNTDRIANLAVRYVNDGTLPEHGQLVTAWLEKYHKISSKTGNPIFSYWRVRKIVPLGEDIGRPPELGQISSKHEPTGEPMKQVNGFVCITNKNIDNKHDERVFFTTQDPIIIELTPTLYRKWSELITNYQEIHKEESASDPPVLQHSSWSRHVTGGEQERILTDGTLCYAHIEKRSGQLFVKDLYPVMITRGLFQTAPATLLPTNLHPPTEINHLSPAERVFGWVNQTGKGSYKGNLRISPAKCNTSNSIESFGVQGFPLAILGQPKPQQFRFYVAQNPQGQSMQQNAAKANGFKSEQGLRGRKVYPHQSLSDHHWSNPTQDRTQQADRGHHQEYRRPIHQGQDRDNQNRSIQAWVKSGTTFTLEIGVTNLSSVEIGALLWLLKLPEQHYHRLGGGKPFGFGSVRLNIRWEQSDLRTGNQWNNFYRSLLPTQVPSSSVQNCIELFKQAITEVYSGCFGKVSFIDAFLCSAKGFDDSLPIHYPRNSSKPIPEGEAFKWFVDNESNDGQKLPLPDICSDRGLPLNPAI